MVNDLVNHITALLNIGRDLIIKYPQLVEETGLVNTKGQKTLAIDSLVEQTFLKYIKTNKLPVRVFSEEIGIVECHPKLRYLIAFDPLDGSTNYQVGKNLFPYGILVAIFNGLLPKIKNVVAAGAYEITQNLSFIFYNNQTKTLTGQLINLKGDWQIDKSSPIYLDLHRHSYYETYFNLAEKLYIRNSGSTIGNLVYVLKNAACGLGHPNIKAEEIGAVYALIKGAGGIVVDHQSKNLGEMDFALNSSYELLAGCKNTIEFAAKQFK